MIISKKKFEQKIREAIEQEKERTWRENLVNQRLDDLARKIIEVDDSLRSIRTQLFFEKRAEREISDGNIIRND